MDGKNWQHVRRGTTFERAHQYDDSGLKEEEVGRAGFQGRVALLYHDHEPNVFLGRSEFKSRAFLPDRLGVPDLADPTAPPLMLLENDIAQIGISRRSEAMTFSCRNLGADEVFFVHYGTGTFVTEFGPIPYEPGDYVVIPRAITYSVRPDHAENFFFVVESNEELLPPEPGPFGRHSPIDPDAIYIPEPEALPDDAESYELRVKNGKECAALVTRNNPFDVVGWKGDYYPFKLNIRDWSPVLSPGVHLPPSAHVFLRSEHLVLVNLVPRPMESDPRTEKLPYYHRNADYDEVAFTHGGTMGVLELPVGMILHTPQGVGHGPQEDEREKQRASYLPTDEWTLTLVMVESTVPFHRNSELTHA